MNFRLNKMQLKVYSHPRSGTHFLEAFLAKNFYKNNDLCLDTIKWGHWSNRKIKQDGNPYGKLFGHHFFPTPKNFNGPGIYIIRDGRAVAYSIWKTSNFLHKDIANTISFSAFLETPLDWIGSPSKKSEPKYTVLEHWSMHCISWLEFAKNNKDLLVIFYEDLIDEPYQVYLQIKRFNFKWRRKLKSNQLDKVKKPTGLLPNAATKSSWKTENNKKIDNLFESQLKHQVLQKKYG